MLEALLGRGRGSISAGVLLDISFDGVALGTKTLTDKAQGISLALQGSAASANTNFGVMDHPTVGRCFQFNGVNWFYNPSNVLKDVSVGSYDLEIAFLKPSATGAQNLIATGNYASVNLNIPGFALYLDQFPQSYTQMFLNRGNAAFQRNMPAGTNPLTFQEIIIEKRKTGMTIRNKTTGQVTTFMDFPVPADSELSIGGQNGGSVVLNGYLKYIRVRKIID